MRNIRTISVLVIALFLAAALALPAAAAAVGGGSFAVSPVLPDNQAGGVDTYFNLTMEQGQTQELGVNVTNGGGEAITVKVELIAATTSRHGDINYVSQDPVDPAMPHPFSEIASTPTEYVSVPAGSSAVVPVTVAMPDEALDGMILGSIRILKEATEEEIASSGMMVNQYAQTLVVILRQNAGEIAPDFALGDVTAELVNHSASVVARIKNPLPAMFSGVTASATVTARESGEMLFEVRDFPIDFAPYAVFPLSFMDEAGYGLDAGSYTTKVSLAYKEQTWEFEEELVIEAEAAEVINESSVNQFERQEEEGSVLWVVVAAVGGVLIVAAAVGILLRQNMKYKKLLSEKAHAE